MCGAVGEGRAVQTRHDDVVSEGEALPTRQRGARIDIDGPSYRQHVAKTRASEPKPAT
jgi:hypothetical protein